MDRTTAAIATTLAMDITAEDVAAAVVVVVVRAAAAGAEAEAKEEAAEAGAIQADQGCHRCSWPSTS